MIRHRLGREHSNLRRGFTLVELMVTIVTVGVLICLLLPAVFAAREAARRSQCSKQLQNLIIAVHHYELQQGRLPSGVVNATGPIRQAPSGYHHNWISAVLPYIEEQRLYERIDFSAGVYDPSNLAVRRRTIPLLICPSQADPMKAGAYSCYAANYHHTPAPIDVNNTGVFFLNSRLRGDDILDGVSNTIYLMEKGVDSFDFGWMSGTHATLRTVVDMSRVGEAPPRQPLPGMPEFGGAGDILHEDEAFPVDYELFRAKDSGGWANVSQEMISSSTGAAHPGAVMVAFGDGRVKAISIGRGNSTPMPELCHREDGRLPRPDDE